MKKTSLSRESRRRLKQSSAYYAGDGLGARSYDLIYGAAAATAVDFFVGFATEFGGPVLELGAGTGLIAWPIAAAGFDVVAVDLSLTMLDLAENKRSQYPNAVGGRISFIQGDMADLHLDQAFGTVIVPGSSFQHLTTRDAQHAALKVMFNHLEPGGGLVLSLLEPDPLHCIPGARLPDIVQTFEDPLSGHRLKRMFRDRKTDAAGEVLHETIQMEQIDREGDIVDAEESSWSLRWSHQSEIRNLIRDSGFEVVAQFSDYDGAPPGRGSEQIWVMQRPGAFDRTAK